MSTGLHGITGLLGSIFSVHNDPPKCFESHGLHGMSTAGICDSIDWLVMDIYHDDILMNIDCYNDNSEISHV